jgi:hypothetical protein
VDLSFPRRAVVFGLDRYDRQMRTFRDMTARLGIDPVDFARDCLGYRLTTAIRRCSACPSGDACRAWLAGNPEADDAPAFCPNRAAFRAGPARAAGPAVARRSW